MIAFENELVNQQRKELFSSKDLNFGGVIKMSCNSRVAIVMAGDPTAALATRLPLPPNSSNPLLGSSTISSVDPFRMVVTTNAIAIFAAT